MQIFWHILKKSELEKLNQKDLKSYFDWLKKTKLVNRKMIKKLEQKIDEKQISKAREKDKSAIEAIKQSLKK